MANYIAMAAILEPGDEVVIESPAYDPLLASRAFLGANVKRFERRFEDGFRVDPDSVDRRGNESHAADRDHQYAQSRPAP